MDQKNIDQLISAANQAKSSRGFIDTIYRDSFDWVDPVRGSAINNGSGQQSQDSNVSQAENTKNKIYDSTGAECATMLTSAIMGGMTPSNAKWFDVDDPDNPENRDVWLDESSDICWKEIHAANFNAVGFETIYDSIIAGAGVAYIDFNEKTRSLMFSELSLAGAYFYSSIYGGMVDTLYQFVSLTAEQAFNEYGEDSNRPNNKGVHQDIIQALKNGDKTRKFDFVHCIHPRSEYGEGQSATDLPFASVHIDLSHKTVCRESGYHEFPCVVPRWFVIPGGDNATGPIWKALPDIKTLNETVRIILQNAEMQMAGMYTAIDDGVINPSAIKVGPRRIIVMNEPGGFMPITPSGNIGVGEVIVQNLRAQIRKIMMTENLQLPQGEQMTTVEVNVRLEQLRQLIGPIFGRLEAEWLKPLVERCFGLLLRAGKIPPPPEPLAATKLSVRFLSPLARAQRMADVAAMDRFEASLGGVAAIKPEILDVYDWDSAERERSYLLGVPQKLINEPVKVKQIRDARAEQQQQAAEQQQEQMMAIEQSKRPQQ